VTQLKTASNKPDNKNKIIRATIANLAAIGAFCRTCPPCRREGGAKLIAAAFLSLPDSVDAIVYPELGWFQV